MKNKVNIIPVASGKGGVGKTMLCSNLGIKLAQSGKKTVVIDCDLGASNLHTYLGIKNTGSGIAEFIRKKDRSLSEFRMQTTYSGLEIITGDQLIPDAADLTRRRMEKLAEGINSLEREYIILDLSAGSSRLTTDLFLLSGTGIMVITPVYGSVLNAYNFLRTVVYKLFRMNFPERQFSAAINSIKQKNRDGEYPSFWDILNRLGNLDKKRSMLFKKKLDGFSPLLVYNMVESAQDVDLIRRFISLVYNKLIIVPEILGYIPKSAEVHNSIRERKPFIETNPECKAAQNLETIASELMQKAGTTRNNEGLFPDAVDKLAGELGEDFSETLPAEEEPAALKKENSPDSLFDLYRRRASEIGDRFLAGKL